VSLCIDCVMYVLNVLTMFYGSVMWYLKDTPTTGVSDEFFGVVLPFI